ncbi:hypothetical protein BCD48_22120 [Pseudofrankia sp. BMG5.36]|nr:hypothetical protein BCD48_22120 [Pseudofrankia sp. BMG5.36]
MPSAGPPDRPTGRFGSKARLTWPLVLAGLALVALSGYRLAAPELSAVEAPSAGRVLPPPVTATASAPPATASPAPLLPPPVVADPVRLRIPAIAVDAPVVGLGLTPQGAIDVPTQWGDVGWYKPGVAPGAVGPAVLVGHYDSKKGPAVFYRLRSLLPGDQLTVVGVSGASVTFVVDRSETVSKAAFPTQRVYGPVTRPEIRLITCDGGFDERTHHYLDNLVVYGHAIPTPVVPPAQGLPAAPGATPAAVPTPVGVTPPVSPAGAQPTPSAGTPAGVASAAPVSAPPASAGSASAGLTPPPPASVAPAVPSAATPRPSG